MKSTRNNQDLLADATNGEKKITGKFIIDSVKVKPVSAEFRYE